REVAAEQLPAATLVGLLQELVGLRLVTPYLTVGQGRSAFADEPGRPHFLLLFAHKFAHVPELCPVEADAEDFIDAPGHQRLVSPGRLDPLRLLPRHGRSPTRRPGGPPRESQSRQNASRAGRRAGRA